MNKGLVMEHIKNHVDYPATASELKEACEKMSDFSDEDKKWFMDHLPDGVYNSADEAMEVLGFRGGHGQVGSMM